MLVCVINVCVLCDSSEQANTAQLYISGPQRRAGAASILRMPMRMPSTRRTRRVRASTCSGEATFAASTSRRSRALPLLKPCQVQLPWRQSGRRLHAQGQPSDAHGLGLAGRWWRSRLLYWWARSSYVNGQRRWGIANRALPTRAPYVVARRTRAGHGRR